MVDFSTQNLYLIGMMGSWKTTVGKILANVLGREFSDIDTMIESHTKMKISDIFDLLGENKFRKEETHVLTQISESSGAIVSTGGGIILSKENRKIIKESGYTIFLNAPPSVLAKRIKISKKRPILNPEISLEKQLQDIWSDRKDWYNSTANKTIETDELSSKEVAELILRIIRNTE